MVESIVSTGLAIGCIYALIAITYNVMFSASRVFSFTAGTLGMLGGVLGSLFIARMGLPVAIGFLLALAGGAVLGIVTEIVAVRPVLKSLDQYLYVLSTLALALMVQQFTAIEWSTEPQPFPRLVRAIRSRRGFRMSSRGHRVFTQLSALDNVLLAAYDLPRSERADRLCWKQKRSEAGLPRRLEHAYMATARR
jgi:branched-subunit amino acid ABC-type transport system permease component